MPNPNPLNPLCPCCNKPMSSNSTQKSGARVYRCRRGCKNERGKTVTVTDSDRQQGGQPIGDRPMSDKELRERWKNNDPEGYKESQKRRNKRRKKK